MPTSLSQLFATLGVSRDAMVTALDQWRQEYGRQPDFIVLTLEQAWEMFRWTMGTNSDLHHAIEVFREGRSSFYGIPLLWRNMGTDIPEVGLHFGALFGPPGPQGAIGNVSAVTSPELRLRVIFNESVPSGPDGPIEDR